MSINRVLDKKVKMELFRRGVIAPWFLLSHQFPLYDIISKTQRDIVVPNITRRFGKSSVCVAYTVEEAIKKKQTIRYATAFLSDLQNFIKPIFEMVLENCPEDMRPVYLESKKIYKFKNGSTISLIGLDRNPDGIRGNNIDLLVIDEAGFVDSLEYLYRSIIVPATANRKFKIIFPSTPPVSPSHFWAKVLIPKAKLAGTYLKQTMDDNTYLPPEEKERLINEIGGRESDACRREFWCEIISDPIRAVCPTFKEDLHVADVPEPTYCNWTFAGDTGGLKDYTVGYMVAWSHEYKKVVFWDEAFYPNRTPTSVMIEGFKALEGEKKPTRWLDAHGQTQVDLAFNGFSAALPPKDDFQSGLQLIRAAFHNNQIIVHPRCKLLILTLTTGLLNRNGTDYERTEELGHCDAIAAAIYGLRVVDRTTDYRPNVMNQDKWFTQDRREQPGASELRKLGWKKDRDSW